MRVALAQLNPTVGDVAGNAARVTEAIRRAEAEGVDVVVTPELVILGYPPRDLIFRQGVVEACEAAVEAIAQETSSVVALVGYPRRAEGGVLPFRNSVAVCRGGRIDAVYDKQLLPGYDVFDEDRYFEPGRSTVVVDINGTRAGVVVCEDIWRADDVRAEREYAVDPVAACVEAGAEVLLAPSASPFVLGKFDRHIRTMEAVSTRHGIPIAMVNQVGGNDDLVFDGQSVVVNARGQVHAIADPWQEDFVVVDLDGPASGGNGDGHDLWGCLTCGVRDYFTKTRHDKAIVGLSGGIDSALTATIAAGAIGGQNVVGVLMPSKHSSEGSLTDARDLTERLGMTRVHEVPISDGHDVVHTTLANGVFPWPMTGLTDENIQARLRGLLLMAVSNASGGLVLATSNKSELAVGYSTLYGDMCGALSVIGDLTKTRVYELSRWINEHHAEHGFDRAPIPEASITKPPSAELRPDQTDLDSLPPYDVLDDIVERYVEAEQSVTSIIEETSVDAATVRRFTAMIDRAEFKRFQGSIILKVTGRAFGRGRPWPIVAR